MFYTLIEMLVYNLMLPFYKIWDITKQVKKDYLLKKCGKFLEYLAECGYIK